jgi:hypothetical protein
MPDARICLSGTTYQDEHQWKDKLSDFLLAWKYEVGSLNAAAIELKGGDKSLSDVHSQLQNGAIIIQDLLDGIRVSFLPLLVHNGIRPVQNRQLLYHREQYRVMFRHQSYSIALQRCGHRLGDKDWNR